MIGWIYLAGFAITWIAALSYYVKSEFDGDTEDLDIVDWIFGTGLSLAVGLLFPIAAIGIVPVLIVKHISKKNRDSF